MQKGIRIDRIYKMPLHAATVRAAACLMGDEPFAGRTVLGETETARHCKPTVACR
jgi:hypothetical protein